MKTDVLIVEGMGSSFTDDLKGRDDKTISHDTLPIIFKKLNIADWKEVHSTRVVSRRTIREWLRGRAREDKNLLIVCKSMGVVEMHDYFENNWADLTDYNRIGWFCVDGHSKLWKHMFRKKYCEKKAFVKHKNWSALNMTIYNIYQHDKRPKGAYFKGADENLNITDKGVLDHWKIIDNEYILALLDMCDWLRN